MRFTTGSDTSCDDSVSVLICFLSYITNNLRLSPQLVEMKFYLGQTLGSRTRLPLPLSYSGPQRLPERSGLSVDVDEPIRKLI